MAHVIFEPDVVHREGIDVFFSEFSQRVAIASARGSTVLYNVEMFMVDMRVLEREHAFVRLEAGHLRNHVQKGVSTMRC